MSEARVAGLPDDLLAWIEHTARGWLARVDRMPGGGRKEAWAVDVEHADRTVEELFLRYDPTDPAITKDPWTLHREAGFYIALQATDVPVPRVLGVHPQHQAMLSERVVGEGWFGRVTDPAEQLSTAKDFMVHLAALHRLDAAHLDLPTPLAPCVSEAVASELDELEGVLAGRGGDVDPALRVSLDWLRRSIPAYDGPVVVVQGDTGPGNFMCAGGRVVAVVDWELAHLGDPMDDIAWLTLRCVQDPFPDLPARLREYEVLSGHAIDETRVRYYRVMAETKLQVMGHGARGGGGGGRGGGGVDVGNHLIYATLHRRLWLEALADAVGLEQTPAEQPPPRQPAPHEWLYEAVLDQLREVVVPRSSDPLVVTRAKGVARAVKYLAAVAANGSFYEACELDDLAKLLAHRPASLAAGRAEVTDAVRRGELSDQDHLCYLWRRVARETELARPAMGALANRHWPALR